MSMNTRLLLITFYAYSLLDNALPKHGTQVKTTFVRQFSKTVFYPITIIKPKKISST